MRVGGRDGGREVKRERKGGRNRWTEGGTGGWGRKREKWCGVMRDAIREAVREAVWERVREAVRAEDIRRAVRPQRRSSHGSQVSTDGQL